MQSFHYRWVDDDGKYHLTPIESVSKEALIEYLDRQDITFISIHNDNKRNFHVPLLAKLSSEVHREPRKDRIKITRRELIEFTIFLGTLVDAGIPIIGALKDYENECEDPIFKFAVNSIIQDLLDGGTLNESLEQYPKIFSIEYVHLIEAGEETGTLPITFKELYQYLEWLEKVDGEVRQATMYPKIVMIVLAIFGLYLFSAIIPKIAVILVGLNVPLPFVTILVLGISDFAKAYWIPITIIGTATPILLQYLSNKYDNVAYYFDKLRLQVPVIGPLLKIILQSRFVFNFAILHRAGISVIKNLDLASRFIGNRVFSKAIIETRNSVRDGGTITESLRETGVFSGLVLRMMVVGESTGHLEESLVKVSEYYNEELPRRLKKVLSIIEPMLILFLVAVVGIVALAIFLPMLSLEGSIS